MIGGNALVHQLRFKSFHYLAIVSFILSLTLSFFVATSAASQSIISIKIDARPQGMSTRYIGAVEGNVNFDRADLQDLGINTYRIYGGMSRWEFEDDDGVYGSPSIAAIKRNPKVINWQWWDNAMTNPPNNSDYWWSGLSNEVWQGNAHTLFATLKEAGIRPVLSIRNTDDSWHPDWALQLNPPRDQADWNEWWEHVFATAYWLNVRNDYQVNDFEIHNEPDIRLQGWGGTQADYFELVKVAKDAIDYVYKTYLPDRAYHIYAPVTTENSHWVYDALQSIPTFFDSLAIHNYADDISSYIQQVHQWLNGTIHANSPVWLSEWGTYTGGYEELSFALNLLKNLIRASRPGVQHIYGSHIFSLYDWGQSNRVQGLIGADGERRLSYYTLRMGIRALQGGRPTFSTFLNRSSDEHLTAIATQDIDQTISLLMVNTKPAQQLVNVDLSNLSTRATGRVWEFSAAKRDEMIGNIELEEGRAVYPIPANAAILMQF